MKYGLQDNAIQGIHGVLSRFPQVTRATLYGSRAKGNQRKGSDIDLALCGDADLTLKVLCKIAEDLEALSLPYTFDLALRSAISGSDLLEHINRAGVVFYEKGSDSCRKLVE